MLARALGHLPVQRMRAFDSVHVGLDAQARLVRHGDRAADDLERLAREPFAAFLPDPVGVDGSTVTFASGRRRLIAASACSSSSGAITPPLSLKSPKP